jgi:hypothetical protein
MDDTTIWFFGMYAIGTMIGFGWGYKRGVIAALN